MEKFVLVTRGRTGSTAVIDELGKCRNLVTVQEIFTRGNYTEKELKDYIRLHGRPQWGVLDNPTEKELKDHYKLLPDFNVWKQEDRWIPTYSDSLQAHRYLMCAEKLAQSNGVKGFGWKALISHFDERPFLRQLLKQHNYRVVYLRRNSTRQVLSGMVALQRGIYNSLEKIEDERRYHIDGDKFQWHVHGARMDEKIDCARLSAEGFDFVVVSYEDYLTNRDAFYGQIFNLLNLPLELPSPSDYVKMINDPKTIIENYDEIAGLAAAMGEKL